MFVSLSATLLGLVAIILIKALEMWHPRGTNLYSDVRAVKAHPSSPETLYGTIQNGNFCLAVCLLVESYIAADLFHLVQLHSKSQKFKLMLSGNTKA